MSAPIGPYQPFYEDGYKDLPDNTTPPKSDALNHWDEWFGTVVDKVDGLAIGAVDTTGSTSGEVLTVVTPGQPAVFQVPTDVAAAAATAVAAYLAANPPGNVVLAAGYMSLPGVNGSYAQCPDAAGNRVTGDIDVRWYGVLGSLVTAGFQGLVMKQSSTVTSWMFRQNSAGNLQFSVSSDGTTIVSGTANAATPATTGLRATWVKSTGVVQFFKLDAAGSVTATDDGYGTKWTQIGTNRTASTAGSNLYTSGGAPLTVGAAGNGTTPVSAATVISKVVIRSGIDGTVVADPTFAGHTFADTTFADGHSNTWTVAGTAAVVPVAGTVLRNGTTLTFATPGTVQAAVGGNAWNRRNGLLRTYLPQDYGDLTTSDETRRQAYQGAINGANAAGGGVVDCNGPQRVIGPNTSLLNQITGRPYTCLSLLDGVRMVAENPWAGGLQTAAGANCHLIAHNGRLNNSNLQDNIKNASISGLMLDGNKTLQDGCHDHDGIHLPQYPGVRIYDCVLQNFDGHGYYSTANGDFALSIADLGQNSNATVVKPLWLLNVSSISNARWGFMMSATNRKTHERDLYATGNGTAQARVVGKTPSPTISVGGTLAFTIDSSGSVASITLAAGDTLTGAVGHNIITKINTVLGGAATASISASTNRLMVTSATTGGLSWVGVDNSSTSSVLADLGLAKQSDNGPLPGTPMRLNGENNSQVGGCEYGGIYADHSEAGTDGWFAESNIGDGVYWHNVNMCMFGGVETTNNNGYGAVINELNTSRISEILAGMNCVDLGYASYRPRTILNASSVAITTPKAEVLFLAGAVGYGVTSNSVVGTIIAPGIKSSLGAGADNRHADCAVVIEHGVASTLTIGNGIYGPDGGLNGDGLGATIRDYR